MKSTGLLDQLCRKLPDIAPVKIGDEKRFILFFSVTDGTTRAQVVTVNGATLGEALQCGTEQLLSNGVEARWIRVDWVDQVERQNWQALKTTLTTIKRNYFRLGIALDSGFQHAFLEMELNANAMLYGGPREAAAVLNERNFSIYARKRHGLRDLSFADDDPVWLFTTKGAFIRDDGAGVQKLLGHGLDAGRRTIDQLTVDDLGGLIARGSEYLASQVRTDGRFNYGWHPCFDRPINSYNGLRHASSLYSMLEAWEVTRSPALKDAIDRALSYLTQALIRAVSLPDGERAAFLVDEGNEIKLGANAVAILALAKHSELTGETRHHALLKRLGMGILHMQDEATGGFVHVLNYPSLEVKQAFRIIYYEGEAAFGLMRLYALTGEGRWLEAVERAFKHFIREEHWKAHDHWLSYCVSELTLHRPQEDYYQFGIDNFRGCLDFVLKRITTFPTLLELMMAAQTMTERLSADPALSYLLDRVDMSRFYKALHHRAHYLLNGHFWPEIAMFFAAPTKIAGSFFIRHHGFRVRIDDVEHYLSGLIAYRAYLLRNGSSIGAQAASALQDETTHWTAAHVLKATGGRWVTPPAEDWQAGGLCIFAPTKRQSDMVVVRLKDGERGVPLPSLSRLPSLPSAVICSDPSRITHSDAPVLATEDVDAAILSLGEYARERMRGKLIGVTGSAGKTTTVAMMAHALEPFGGAEQTRHNANLPYGVAWNLASVPWDKPYVVLELAIGRMARTAQMTRPDLVIFTNVLPAHLEYHQSVEVIADRKSLVFNSMAPGSTVVLNRDMVAWERVYAAAKRRGLRVLNYGQSAECEFRLLGYDSGAGLVTARRGTRDLTYRIGAEGLHMAYNSLAVLAAVSALGHETDAAIDRLADFSALPGRGEEAAANVDGQRITLIDDAYNANPGSMAAALSRLGEKTGNGRRIAVLGEMLELGDAAADHHTSLAPLIERHGIDRIYAVGPLYADFWEHLPESRRGLRASSHDELMPELRRDLRDDDLVLVKGSRDTQMHRLADWLRSGAPEFAPHLACLLHDVDRERILRSHGEERIYPPASLTKLLTLSLVVDHLRQSGESVEREIPVSSRAADVNSRWGFEAHEAVPIGTLMRATMIVSANEAANALAEWHSGSIHAFTECLNRRAAELGMSNTCFSSPSGLGRGQRITLRDTLTLASHILIERPAIAALARERHFEWKNKCQKNTNTLLDKVSGADGLKTGRLGSCFNLLFSVVRPEGRRLAIVLGARSRAERDGTVKTLLQQQSQAMG